MTNNNYLYIIVILLYIIIYNNITLYVNPIPYILIVKLLIVNVRFASLSVFRDKFHPAQSFVVGSGGIPIDEFLSWDIGRLLDREQRRQSKTRLSYAES